MIELPAAWRARAMVLEGPADRSLFSNEELATADAFKLAKRRNEWLLSRQAAKRLGTRRYVSYSHSGNYAGAASDDEPIGIDVQVVRDLDERVAHLFLSDAETAAMQRCTLPHRLLHFWCAKEAAWKPRSERYATLKQLPLTLVEERADGLLFDLVETVAIGEVIVALTSVES
ncbi:MAG TPA: 4'-phosphopantetheinyl transferase superfamily protein [Thermoanaerobaculia bacterium]|nr:4'-phosphopantetheinyl transferase superfamily protein [Thermoanaerobaculia bacterium]